MGRRRSEKFCYLSALAEVPAQASSAVYGAAGCICTHRATTLLQMGECSSEMWLPAHAGCEGMWVKRHGLLKENSESSFQPKKLNRCAGDEQQAMCLLDKTSLN